MTMVAAIDLGASSGRVMLGRVGPGTLELAEVTRFANEPVRVAGTLHWDILALYRQILDGLRRAGPVESIGVNSWGVDYGLIDDRGTLVGNPVHYRDARTDGVMEAVVRTVGAAELYRATGIQFLPFNTVFQLASRGAVPAASRTLLLIPDLIAYWLTGEIGVERTNASTTALLDPTTGDWSPVALAAAGIARGLLPPLREPGTPVGPLRTDVAAEVGHGRTPVTAVATHDTGSAVVAVPAQTDRFAYISCGTWSLVGVELPAPVLTEDGRAANFTNEVGVDGTIRYLRNVMGLWPLQECLRAWGSVDLTQLLVAAAQVPAFTTVVDLDDPVFLPPGDMPARIAAESVRRGVKPPETPPEFARCILDSLAVAHQRAVSDAARLTGRAVDVVHIVGGGSRNALLCQLTADACGVPVVAGPEEATAIGNVLVQARALGAVRESLADLRGLVARSQPVRYFQPR
jgi:rhamnulokinase